MTKTNWIEKNISDITEVTSSKRIYLSEYVPFGIPFFRGKEIIEKYNGNDVSTELFIKEEKYNEIKNKFGVPSVGDILLTSVGTIGIPYFVEDNEKFYFKDGNLTWFRKFNKDICSKFLYYWIVSPEGNGKIKNRSIGSSQSALTIVSIKGMKILLPPLVTQQKIASILSAYDDLIENNNKRIKILEQTANSIYKEWFVNFNFPENKDFIFENTKIGKIPKGWLCSFEEIADPLEGPGLRRWQFKDSGIPFVNIRTLIPNDIDLTKVQFIDEQEVNSKYKHFLLQEYDHIVSSSGTLGRIVIIQKRHLPLMLNTSIIRMRTKQNSIGKWQLKHFLNSSYFQNQIKSVANGAAQLNYGPSHLKTMFGIKPSESLSAKFELLVNPMELEIMNLSEKNSILNKTKNLLLPKLISGELDVEGLDIKIRPEIL